MKNILLIPVAFLLLFVFSCRSSSDDPVEVSPLIGKWQPYRAVMNATLSTGPYTNTIEYSECMQKTRVTFSDNNTGGMLTYGEENGTCVQQENVNFTYTHNPTANTLNITRNGQTQNGKIKTLSKSDLVYIVEENFDIQGETVPANVTFYLRKTKD